MNSSSESLLTHSARRLNQLALALQAKRYLEIGVETGVTFHQVECDFKTGVDPQFLFDRVRSGELNLHGYCDYHETTSDLFFRGRSCDSEPYDLVFIDGLHHFDQVMRDFINAVAFAHARTVFLIDDTIPCDSFSAIRDQRQALELRSQFSMGYKGNNWHGDVYLFVLLLPVYFPSFRYRTLVGHNSNPQTILWLDPALNEENEWTQARSLWAAQNLSACGFTWLLENIDMLQVVDEREGLELVINRLL